MGEAEEILVAWLEGHGPDDWHQVAIDWNWDAGLEVLAWIGAQPGCDKATAQSLIVMGGADYYLRFSDRAALLEAEPYNIEVFDLLLPIIARWNAGEYTRSQISSYEPAGLVSQQRRYQLAREAQSGTSLPFRLDESVFQPLQGREFSYRYTEGWPSELEAELRARGVAY